MKKLLWIIPIYILVLCAMIAGAFTYSHAVTTSAESELLSNRHVVILDAGHGGIDGGATSVSGILESQINLEITLRLNDLMHLLGIKTILIRHGDYSVHTSGTTIAQKKVSDLKERVRIVNGTPKGFLISIHQNYFQDGRYFGPQVFYGSNEGSKTIATELQNALNNDLLPQTKRNSKASKGIYLMENIHVDGILVECGFISNYQEEQRLLSPDYQKKLCCVIATAGAQYLYQRQIA